MQTLRLVRAKYPKMMLCLATNGLGIGPYIDELADLQVSHVTITITAINPAIAGEIYAWIRDGKRPLRGEEAATLLIARQTEALFRLKSKGIVVKINSIIIPGINDEHIPDIARKVGEMGADIMNCMPLVPVKGSAFEELPEPDALTTARVRLQSGLHLPQMSHCARCRADAVGFIGENVTAEQVATLRHFANGSLNPAEDAARPYVAVATLEGALVNQHLGEADRLAIFEANAALPGTFRLIEIRRAPDEGGGEARWAALAESLKDCRAILVNAAGPAPQKALSTHGLKVIEMDGLIEEGLKAVFAGKPIPASMKRRFTGCGAGISCKGTGAGCG
jgi:nitrogen fixation protein NifB